MLVAFLREPDSRLRFRGGPLEKGLERVLSDVTIGSLLVQSDARTGEPLLLHVMLPKSIRQRHLASDTWVFLLDAQVSVGSVPQSLALM